MPRPHRGRTPGAAPAAALSLDQLVLGYRDLRRRQVKGLAAFHTGDRPTASLTPSPDGGIDEFRDVFLSRFSSSAIHSLARPSSATASASSPRSDTTSAAST